MEFNLKYLIFTASAGNGHNSTARRIGDRLFERDSSAEIKISDAYKKYAGIFNEWIIDGAYKLVCDYAAPLYNVFFKRKEKIDYRANDRDGAVMQGYCVVSGMLKEIYDFKPDVIFSTYEFCSVALSNLRRVYDIPAKIFAVTLDYGVSPYWERCSYGVDGVFLTDENTVEKFLERGFSEDKLFVTGIPVAKEFSEKKDKKESRLKVGLDKTKFTVLIAKASFFAISDRKIVSQISKFNENVQTVIINGDERKRKKIQRLLDKNNLAERVKNLGYVKDVADYFAAGDAVICKGGGLTLAECVNAGLPALIIKGLPLQERHNKDALINCGCATEVKGKNLAKTVNALAADEKKRSAMSKATEKLRRADAIDDICQKLESCPPADYTKITLNDGKKEIRRKVKKATRLAAKNYRKQKKLAAKN